MALETLVCKESNGEHDSIVAGVKAYSKHAENWEETMVLRCRVCGKKRVPEDEVDA